MAFEDILNFVNQPGIGALILAVIILVVVSIFITFIKKYLLQKAKSMRQVSSIKIFTSLVMYIVIIGLIIYVISSFTGSLSSFALGAGLFSAALGWALQRPITGIAAWIMVILKRPFNIGDRIIIGDVRGDVIDLTLTHIYIGEIGGLVGGEETSGRVVLVPNSVLFERNIINYKSEQKSEKVLDQVVFRVTFDSDIDKAVDVSLKAAKKILDKEGGEGEYARTYFDDSGIKILIRYHSPAKILRKVSSDITREIFKSIKNADKVRLAYTHHEVDINQK